MTTSKRPSVIGGILFGLALVLGCYSGCGPSNAVNKPSIDKKTGESSLEGKIKVDGSSTVLPISERAAKSFSEKYPKVNVTVGRTGTGGGFKVFTIGEIDIADASRPITKEELEQCEKNSVKFIELPIAYDGLTVALNIENDWVDQLTVDDLKKIYLEGGVKKWNEVNSEWPDLAIDTFGAGKDSGTYDYFREVLGGKKVELRRDMSESEDDNVLVSGVAGKKSAIGFFGVSYYFANKSKIKAAKIVNPKGDAIAPAHDVILSGEYAPLSRPLFIYVSQAALERREVQRFAEHYLENAAELAEKAGYVSLPKEVYDRAKKTYDDEALGTHYLTAEGEKREGTVTEVYERANLQPMK